MSRLIFHILIHLAKWGPGLKQNSALPHMLVDEGFVALSILTQEQT